MDATKAQLHRSNPNLTLAFKCFIFKKIRVTTTSEVEPSYDISLISPEQGWTGTKKWALAFFGPGGPPPTPPLYICDIHQLRSI